MTSRLWKRVGSHIVVSMVCAIVLLLAVSAQVTTGIISGTVKDSSGAVLPGANVKAVHVARGTSREVITDDTGHFAFPQLALGEYEVQGELPGFRAEIRRGILLTVGTEAVVNLILQVGEVSEKVVVSGQAPLVETTSSSLSGLVDDKQIRDLPLNGRSFDQLITLTSGTVQFNNKGRNGAIGMTSGFSAGGARWDASKFTWDGLELIGSVSNSTTPNSASGKLMGVEAIQEFAVVTNNGDATYGKKFGGQINIVSRSGTNNFHSSTYWFLRNNHLDARNFFDRGDVPQFKQNNFGVAVGGPIRQNKSWFFVNYEGFRQRLGLSNVAIVPDADARRGILPRPDPANPGRLVPTNVGIAAGVVPFLAFFPEPNGPNLGGGTALAFSSPTEKVHEDFLTFRLDHTISEAHNLYECYMIDNSTDYAPRLNPHFIQFTPFRNQQILLGLKSVFSPTVLTTAIFGFARATGLTDVVADGPITPAVISVPGERLPGVANFAINGLSPSILGGFGSSALLAGRFHNRNQFTYADQLNVTRGRHFLQMGSQIERIQANEDQGTTKRGNWSFDGLFESLQGRASSFSAAVPGSNGTKGWRQTYVSFFFQDNFRILPPFNLNMGLRYEFMTNPSEVNGRVANFDFVNGQSMNPLVTDPIVTKVLFAKNQSLKNLAPRIGFAWDVSGKGTTAVRGGFGIFYDQIQSEFRRFTGANPPFYAVLQASSLSFPQTSAFLTVQGLPRPLGISRNAKVPTMLQYNLRIEQLVGAQMRISAAFVGSHAFHLSRTTNPQAAIPVRLENGRLFNPPGTTRRNVQLASNGISLIIYDANSFYDSLQLDIEQRLSRGLRFKAAYTWSKSIDDASGTVALTGSSTTDFFPTNHKQARGYSNFDTTQSFVFNSTYDLPFASLFRSSGRWVEGWQLSGILNLQSGQPFSVEVGFPRSRNGTTDGGDRPDLAPGASSNPILGTPQKSPRYFNAAAFILQPEGFIGNLGRNTLRSPRLATVDMGLQKLIPIREPVGLQFRIDGFNLLNRANFNFPASRALFDRQGAVLGSAGVITETATTSRQLQLSLKFLF